MCNLFGYIPAPFVYGLINVKSKNNRLAMYIGIYYSFVGLFFISLATIYRYRDFNNKNSDSKETKNLHHTLSTEKEKDKKDFYERKSSLPKNINLMFQANLGNELIDNQLEKEDEDFVKLEAIEENNVEPEETMIMENEENEAEKENKNEKEDENDSKINIIENEENKVVQKSEVKYKD